jgi:DNA-binding CsgD family transcriptional regulator
MSATLTPIRRRIAWTPEIETKIRTAYAMSSKHAKATALRRIAFDHEMDVANIYDRAQTLGIQKVTGMRRPWTEAEVQNLTYYAGKVPLKRIAAILGRSLNSVAHRMRLLKLSSAIVDRGYTRAELADVMGIAPATVAGWIQRKKLALNLCGLINETEVVNFLCENLEELELRQMDQCWLKQILRMAIA